MCKPKGPCVKQSKRKKLVILEWQSTCHIIKKSTPRNRDEILHCINI